MKRHPLDALTLVALAFVLVAGVLWGMWYAGWEPVSLAIAAPLLLVLLGTVGLVATLIAARQAGRRQREQRTAVADLGEDRPPADTEAAAEAEHETGPEAEPAPEPVDAPTDTLTLEDLTRPSDDREDRR
ncbi:hypothetical protein FE697_014375 [Mumia zhuanghuii]|uniref:Lipopolysaccharide assembly protein A domain-containing protein n=2 Tax=Mumia TaxID=1546255 RepID=A0ABW1QPF4_9ACTN|nr:MULTISPECIES: hypothetical protein [Mumia]KAA1422340.1 hypothetical protein FE697_014375 [Mumia zhuanghuii]